MSTTTDLLLELAALRASYDSLVRDYSKVMANYEELEARLALRTEQTVDAGVRHAETRLRLEANLAAITIPGTLQNDALAWILTVFGEGVLYDKTERNQRVLEEMLELVQANGCTREQALNAVNHVFDTKTPGDISQELGGALMAMLTLAQSHGVDLYMAGRVELNRLWANMTKVKVKWDAKQRELGNPDSPTLKDAISQQD